MELTPISLIVPEASLGIPGRNAKEAGRASSQPLPACFPLPRLGTVFSQIQGSLYAPFLTPGQCLGASKSPPDYATSLRLPMARVVDAETP